MKKGKAELRLVISGGCKSYKKNIQLDYEGQNMNSKDKTITKLV